MSIYDLAGKKFGKWVAVSAYPRRRHAHVYWHCRCECGTERAVDGQNLLNGRSRSCGCAESRVRSHGKSESAEYKIWASMIQRCTKPVKNYGARGIKVCVRWRKFENFYADMGPRPSPKHSIDRIDNDGNYEPSNCRWATRSEQAFNRRARSAITFAGRTQSMAQWAREVGIPRVTLFQRLQKGWPLEKAIAPNPAKGA
jgi:hypothetical protein